MTPLLPLAHAALLEAGHPELAERIVPHERYGITIKSPCEHPHIAIKAVALAHQRAGHNIIIEYIDNGEGGQAAHFSCFECGLD